MSERILIDIAVDEFEFVKEAISFKARHLIDYLDACKKNAEKPKETFNDKKVSSTIAAAVEHFVTIEKPYSPHTSKRRGRPPLNKTKKGTRK
jgi:hypothetical protein